jgi:flagellar protein FliS
MDPRSRYKSTQSLAWTRVDMLLLIYDQAVSSLTDGALLLEQNRTSELLPVSLKAQRALLMLAEGLRLDRGEIPTQVLRLCVYSLDQIRTESAPAWRSAAKVMATVRDGFRAIQDQARAAEYEGQVPALDAVG